jgi:hypothetical protein
MKNCWRSEGRKLESRRCFVVINCTFLANKTGDCIVITQEIQADGTAFFKL